MARMLTNRMLILFLSLCVAASHVAKKHKHYDVKKLELSKDSKLWVGKTVTIMSFNTWNMAKGIVDGLNKIAKHILINNPDIVGLQEVRHHDEIRQVTESLNKNDTQTWSYVYVPGEDTGIITRHTINVSSISNLTAGIGAQILLDNKRKITLYSMHLDYTLYGPYALAFRTFNNLSVVDHAECHPGYCRCSNIKELVTSEHFKAALARSKTEPLFVVGDFNAPSHLDYTQETLPRRGFVYNWPATFILQNASGLVDSFRELYPDPVKYPGESWSTVNEFHTFGDWEYVIPEPQDRIDFIFYKSSGLKTVASGRYAGDFKPYPADPSLNDWPSDHYAYVSTFKGF
ncbi:unnamed protein product [Bursaphelenchus xylophilus]|uniref:(pine wood nematode) hypothetical protein n=1 Tax=Bursaphelenchus xylophilus TaxID=6326 RepID=A0A1I7S2G3_BURXY|nr:unnamed protein product [Bursaphelenchus xylophilus]CAG9114577.1 unnamed protein product [Bursaphelenchus xylophilus]